MTQCCVRDPMLCLPLEESTNHTRPEVSTYTVTLTLKPNPNPYNPKPNPGHRGPWGRKGLTPRFLSVRLLYWFFQLYISF